MVAAPSMADQRTIERLRFHYTVERELADRLRQACNEERKTLYSSLYNELFARVPDHSQLTRKVDAAAQRATVARQLVPIRAFLKPDSTFLEVGAGDCSVSYAVAEHARHVYAIDVSETITSAVTRPPNFSLIISDGTSIPVPEQSVDVAYSHQLMEHLHVDDAQEQLHNIARALVPGGVYICLTPSRLTGPHDISRHFDTVATCFHLKEYTTTELIALFRTAGFTRFAVFSGVKRDNFRLLPVWPVLALERVMARLPYRVCKKVARHGPNKLLGKLIAFKQA
jgi:ubiquinone/menaquinone biosynthesis C-methylase UbiE